MYNVLEHKQAIAENIQKSFINTPEYIEKAKWQIGEVRVDSRGISHECYGYTSEGKPRLRRVKKNKGAVDFTTDDEKQISREGVKRNDEQQKINKQSNKEINPSTIFNEISLLNPKSTVISSIGEIVTKESKQLAEFVRKEIVEYIPNNTTAMSIIKRGYPFSDKQLWVIAYELFKNPEYITKIKKDIEDRRNREEQKRAKNKAKRAEKQKSKKDLVELVKKNNAFNVGDKVHHQTFGDGIVLAVDDKSITVNFNGVEKKLMKAFVKMDKVNN